MRKRMILWFSLVPVVPAGQTFLCTPTRVCDGDGPVCCAEGPRIRLAGIAARDGDRTSRPNHPCADAPAPPARDALVHTGRTTTGSRTAGQRFVRGRPLSGLPDGSSAAPTPTHDSIPTT